MAALAPAPKFYEHDANGNPLSGGKVYTYIAGTTTPLDTYSNSTGTLNTNPVTLDSSGRADIWLSASSLYKFVVKDSSLATIYTVDNIGGSASYTDLANTSSASLGDALIGFKQSNSSGILSGASPRTVHQKLQENVSVKDFGATGDGTTDDTAAIQAAIDACIANRIETLYFPATDATKYYKVTDTLTVSGRLSLVGDGEYSTTIYAVGFSVGQHIVDFNNDAGDNVYFGGIRDMTLRGADQNPIGYQVKNLSYAVFENVFLYNLRRGYTITGTNCFSNTFRNVVGGSIAQYTAHFDAYTGGGQHTFDTCTFIGTDGFVVSSDSVVDAITLLNPNFEQCTTTDLTVLGTVVGINSFGGRSEGLDGNTSWLITPATGKTVTAFNIEGMQWSSDNGAADPVKLGGAGTVKGFTVTGCSGTNIGSSQIVNLNGQGESGQISGNYFASAAKAIDTPRAGIIVFGNSNSSGALAEYWGTATWGVTQSSFTATATGMTTSPTGTVYYSVVGKTVTLDLPYITGTSNSVSFTLTGAPVAIIPATQKDMIGRVVDNGVGITGMIRIRTNGVIQFYASVSGADFTTSGTKSITENSISYTLY